MRTWNDPLIPAWLQPLCALDLLQARGADADVVLRGSGLFRHQLPFTDRYITPQQWQRIVENSSRVPRSTEFGVQLGQQIAVNGLGPLSQGAVSASTFVDIASLISRSEWLISPLLRVRATCNDSHLYLLLDRRALPGRSVHTMETAALATLSRLWRLVHGEAMPAIFFFQRPRDDSHHALQVHLGSQLRYELPFTGLRLTLTDARRRLPTASPNVHARAEAEIRDLLGAQPLLTDAVVTWFDQAMGIRLELCADHLGISDATLKRRLNKFGYTFQRLLDQYRLQSALDALLVRGQCVESTAEELRFTDLSNFRRCFRRWTRSTPAALASHFQKTMEGAQA